MRSRARPFALLTLVTVLVAPALPALAQRTQSDLVLIREDETVGEDLYAAGNTIVISGIVEGDLVAAAYGDVRIDGEVQGSVTALASSVIIDGTVGGSVRVATGDLRISGTVGGDVFAGAWTAIVGSEAEVARDVLVWGRTATVRGDIGRDVQGQLSRLVLGAEVGRDVEITVGDLIVEGPTEVAGDLVHIGADTVSLGDDVVVEGSLIAERRLPPNVRIRALGMLVRILAAMAVIGLGLGVIWSAPERTRSAASAVSRRPLAALGWGVGLASIPVAIAVMIGLFVSLSPASAGIPLLLVFLPLLFAAVGLLALGLFVSPVPVSAAVGQRIGPARSLYAWFVIGGLILLTVSVLPWIGTAVAVLASLIGLGGWMLSEPESVDG